MYGKFDKCFDMQQIGAPYGGWAKTLLRYYVTVSNPGYAYNHIYGLTKVQHHYSLTNAFQSVFSGKAYWKVVF